MANTQGADRDAPVVEKENANGKTDLPAKKKGVKGRKRKKGGSKEAKAGNSSGSFVRVIKGLYRDIAKHFKKKAISRIYLAKQIGTNQVTLKTWEDGQQPSERLAENIRALQKKVASGRMSDFPQPKNPGRQPKGAKAKGKKAGNKPAPGTNGRRTRGRARAATTAWTSNELAKALLDYADRASDPKPVRAVIKMLMDE